MAHKDKIDKHEKLFSQAGIEDPDIQHMANAIDFFRSIKVDGDLSLPKLVVIGNQSSGKSSLLKSLTQLPFPVGMGTCTRFAVEVALKRDRGRTIHTSVLPAPNTVDNERIRLRTYGGKFLENEFTSAKFVQVFSEVSKLLDIPPPEYQQDLGETTKSTAQPRSSFSEHKLRIEAYSSTSLSFIDTPGLIQAKVDNAANKDREMIEQLVSRLIREERTIIVVVMDARQEVVNQEAFTLAKTVDPLGKRTIGVLTKCDQLHQEKERNYTKKVMNNKFIHLDNGWYAVQSCSKLDNSEDFDLADVHAEEKALFNEEKWSDVEATRCGSPALRQALGRLFADQLRQEFPKIVEEIRNMNDKAKKALDKLGPPRSTTEEQRSCLLEIASRYERIMKEYLTGTYRNPPDELAQIWINKRIAEKDFFEKITRRGSLYQFLSPTEQRDQENIRLASRTLVTYVSEYKQEEIRARYNEKKNIYEWINKNCHIYSVPSPCGLVSQPFVDGLFRSMIDPWLEHTYAFLEQLDGYGHQLVKFVAKDAAQIGGVGEELSRHLSSHIGTVAARNTAEKLLKSERLKLDTCDATFSRAIQIKKTRRLGAAFSALLQAQGLANNSAPFHQFLQQLERLPESPTALQQPRDTVYEVHDILETYYTYASKRYFDNLSKLGGKLFDAIDGPLTHFGPSYVKQLSREDLQSICGENPQITLQRDSLSRKINRLNEALDFAKQISNNDQKRMESLNRLLSQTNGAGVEANGEGSAASSNIASSSTPVEPQKRPSSSLFEAGIPTQQPPVVSEKTFGTMSSETTQTLVGGFTARTPSPRRSRAATPSSSHNSRPQTSTLFPSSASGPPPTTSEEKPWVNPFASLSSSSSEKTFAADQKDAPSVVVSGASAPGTSSIPSTGSIFGNSTPATSSTQHQGGLYGSSAPATSSSLFDDSTSATSSVPHQGALSGAAATGTSSVSPPKRLFGSSNTVPPQGGLFWPSTTDNPQSKTTGA